MKAIVRNISALAVLTAASAAHAQFFDDFNRSDSGSLGANWTSVAGSVGVTSNRAKSAATGANLVTVTGFSGSPLTTTLKVDVFGGSTLGYVALVSGFAGIGLNQALFAKVQDNNGDGTFDNFGLYTGNNNSSGGIFGATTNTFTSARITLWMPDADTYTLGIDTNFDGTFEETHSRTGVSAFFGTLGTGVGMGIFNNTVSADNYSAAPPVPEPASCTVLALGALALLRRRRKLSEAVRA